MKVRNSLKKRCKDCMIVKRGRNSYVICKTNVRHKLRKLFSTAPAQAENCNTCKQPFQIQSNQFDPRLCVPQVPIGSTRLFSPQQPLHHHAVFNNFPFRKLL